MTDKRTELTDLELDTLFASARLADPDPQDDFMARLFADIDDVAAGQAVPPVADVPRRPLFGSIWAALGGWAGAGALAATTAAGVWIGVAQPQGLSGITDTLWADSTTVSIFASEDILGLEG